MTNTPKLLNCLYLYNIESDVKVLSPILTQVEVRGVKWSTRSPYYCWFTNILANPSPSMTREMMPLIKYSTAHLLNLYDIVCIESNEELLLSLVVEVKYILDDCSIWLIFLLKFSLLGKFMSIHKRNGTTKHQVNDLNTLEKLLSLIGFKSKVITIIQR